MHTTSFFKRILFVVSVLFLYSCDKEYNAIGADLLGENHFDFLQYSSDVVAHNQKIGPVDATNLPINALGIYNDPAFGKTTAHFATQLNLAALAPTIGTNAVVDSVYLSVPYFSTLKTTNTDGSHVYELDSIYGGQAPVKLSVFESNYFMRDLDPSTSFTESQSFYTDQTALFENAKIGSRLNNATSVAQNDAFFFDSKEIVQKTIASDGKATLARSVPAMRLKLNNSFFAAKILNAPAAKLATNDAFKEYFRGLYFKIETVSGSAGSMAMMNFKAGKITISYTEDLVTNGVTTRVPKTLDLNLNGNSVSLLDQTNTNSAYSNAVNNPNTSLGDASLYLKGGEGAMTVIDLFKTPGELNLIRTKGWLINEANLVFHIDAEKMASSNEPNRVYLYDLTNNRPVVDYFLDVTNATDVKKSKYVFSGLINKEAVTNGRGQTYKIRITNQIRNLVKYADSTNVKLGLVVTENIGETGFSKLKTPNSFTKKLPKATVMNPLGTVLYGSHPSVPVDKRVKLQIYYTKPN
ncbi:hypothetical protein GENT5_06780 [Flavobacterium ammoniigenes]|jgi:hypothetical protein|uniref:DUF4270 domain-containing protein n=1 Tax=Flavobacterium ammoniigenes TaxID=1751095 RepID=A0ABM7V4A3_9FLAO|nr:DUF4270 domain-containing protein [Flavobacterium ammoniigenes]BDB54373.1 hypothetical protein GENT5_06780 [Flavobacterium ammoniigenes]